MYHRSDAINDQIADLEASVRETGDSPGEAPF